MEKIPLKNLGFNTKKMNGVFKEVLCNIAFNEEKFPIFYVLSNCQIDYKKLDQKAQLDLASILTYLRLIWLERESRELSNDDFFNICNHILINFKQNASFTQKLMALFTLTSLNKFKALFFDHEAFMDWENLYT
ncbi:MAG: hypothetical protein ACXAC7_15610 [Candidatus Hodarchaeales archaeon]|jgi:hypothetical protein